MSPFSLFAPLHPDFALPSLALTRNLLIHIQATEYVDHKQKVSQISPPKLVLFENNKELQHWQATSMSTKTKKRIYRENY